MIQFGEQHAGKRCGDGAAYATGSPRTARRILALAGRCRKLVLALALAVSCGAQAVTQTLSVNVQPAGMITVPATVTLHSTNTNFAALTGSMTVSYWARTQVGGGGAITVQTSSDFAPSGGPAVNDVTFTCGSATLGAGCAGAQPLAISTQTSVVALPDGACTGGSGACSAQDPNTVLLNFSVPNYPRYKTGAYSAHIVFTISTM